VSSSRRSGAGEVASRIALPTLDDALQESDGADALH
jgi:hypothetical protein